MANSHLKLDLPTTGAVIRLRGDQLLLASGSVIKASSKQDLNFSLPILYHPDFFLEHTESWCQFSDYKKYTLNDLADDYRKESDTAFQWDVDKRLFKQHFHLFMEAFHSNAPQRLQKAVPYLFAHTPARMDRQLLSSVFGAALNLTKKYPLYLYGMWNENEGVLGVSPEILFCHLKSDPMTVETMALAGTVPSGKESELIDNAKLQKEHQWVIKGIMDSTLGLGKSESQSTKILKLQNLSHLCTGISVALNQEFHFENAVAALHPTPALGAYPKELGLKWLKEINAQNNRKSYGAPFGVIMPENELAFCVVAIRQIQWNSSGIRIGAGCGIVKESIWEKEWEEIQLKLHAIQKSFGF